MRLLVKQPFNKVSKAAAQFARELILEKFAKSVILGGTAKLTTIQK